VTGADVLGALYLLATVVGFGASTALLRVAILDGETDTARLVRVAFQTAVVLAAVLAVDAASILSDSIQYGAVYPALNGLLSGFAFIAFSKGLESTDASIAKPLLAVGTIVSVALGILLLGEHLTLRKSAGILIGIAAVYLLTTE
jgi:drug/metabolite transporter (DMT)-like permease